MPVSIVSAPLTSPVLKKPTQQPPETIKVFTLSSDLSFGYNDSSLGIVARYKIDEIENKIRHEYRAIDAIELEGNTDRIGGEAYNYDLGLKRAEAVKNELVTRGFDPMIIKVTSFGETHPVTDGCHSVSNSLAPYCLAEDRRVDIKVTGTASSD